MAFTLILALSGCPKQSSFVGAYDLKRGDTLAGYTALTLSFNGGHMVMFMGREGSAPVSAEGSYTDDAASVSVSFDSGQPFGVAGSNWKFLKRGDTLVSDSPGISATLELQK